MGDKGGKKDKGKSQSNAAKNKNIKKKTSAINSPQKKALVDMAGRLKDTLAAPYAVFSWRGYSSQRPGIYL